MCSPSAGMPRPAWMSTGTRRSCASATSSATAGSSMVNCSARGCSLIPRAPASSARAPRPARRRAGRRGRTRRAGRVRGRRGDHLVVGRRGSRPARASGRRPRARRRRRARRAARRGVCLKPSGSLRPMCVCASKRSSGPVSSTIRSSQGRRRRRSCTVARHPIARPRHADTPGMHIRRVRVRIETERHAIEGTLQLPTRDTALALTDFLNAHDTDFIPSRTPKSPRQ